MRNHLGHQVVLEEAVASSRVLHTWLVLWGGLEEATPWGEELSPSLPPRQGQPLQAQGGVIGGGGGIGA